MYSRCASEASLHSTYSMKEEEFIPSSKKNKGFKPPTPKYPIPTYKKLNEENVQQLIQHQTDTSKVILHIEKKNSSFMTNRSNESDNSKKSRMSKDGLPDW